MTSHEIPALVRRSLQRCIGCHDQCMFASAEVVASGRQELVMSRLAASVRDIADGAMTPDRAFIDDLFMSFDQGAQHRHCVVLDGSQDPRVWLAWARAALAADAGIDPGPVRALREARAAAGTSSAAAIERPDAVLIRDGVTSGEDRDAVRLLESRGLRVATATVPSGGVLERFYGLQQEEREAALEASAVLGGLADAVLATDDPAVAYAAAHIWPDNGVRLDVRLLGEIVRPEPVPGADGRTVVVDDVGLLAELPGATERIRELLSAAGYRVVEPPSTGADARDDGPMLDYPDPTLRARVGAARYEELRSTGADLVVAVAPWSLRNLPNGPIPVVGLAAALGAWTDTAR